MWWDHQNLDKPRRDKSGTRWNFRVWHGMWMKGEVRDMAERIFFWNDKKTFCGVMLICPAVHVSHLHQLIAKLVADSKFRLQYKRELRFPLERYYSEYGAFPDEENSK